MRRGFAVTENEIRVRGKQTDVFQVPLDSVSRRDPKRSDRKTAAGGLAERLGVRAIVEERPEFVEPGHLAKGPSRDLEGCSSRIGLAERQFSLFRRGSIWRLAQWLHPGEPQLRGSLLSFFNSRSLADRARLVSQFKSQLRQDRGQGPMMLRREVFDELVRSPQAASPPPAILARIETHRLLGC